MQISDIVWTGTRPIGSTIQGYTGIIPPVNIIRETKNLVSCVSADGNMFQDKYTDNWYSYKQKPNNNKEN